MVTGVDDHSRFCVIAAVVERATGRAVCLALAAALARFGVPEEILTDNGKQFTDRFGKGGEVLFDKICRHNGDHPPADPAGVADHDRQDRAVPPARCAASCSMITSRSSRWQPRRPRSTRGSPSTTPTGPTRRSTGHGRSPRRNGSPRSREQQRELLAVWLPPTLARRCPTADPDPATSADDDRTVEPDRRRCWAGGPVEFDRVVPPSGNMELAGRSSSGSARPGPGRSSGSGPTAT